MTAPLHPEAFRILTVLHDQELHGYVIVKELKLRTLLADGLLEETDDPADEDVDERRRYFAVISLGRAVARAEAQRMEGLLRRIEGRLVAPTHGALTGRTFRAWPDTLSRPRAGSGWA